MSDNMNDVWENRYAPRQFSSKSVDTKHIDKINKAIINAPQQGGACNNYWLCLGPSKYELKLWLVKNIYKTKYGKNVEYFPALAEAPYLFTSFIIDDISKNSDPNVSTILNNSFIGGIILSQAVELGLNVLPIACRNDWLTTDESIKKEFKQLMFNEIKDDVKHIVYAINGNAKHFDADSIIEPALNLAVGYGDNPHTMNKQDAEYLDGVVRYQKIRKSERMFSISL